MVASIHDDVLGYGDLVRDQYELKEKKEIIELENTTTEKELAELQIKAKLDYSLYEKVDRYDSLLTLAAQIVELKASLVKEEER